MPVWLITGYVGLNAKPGPLSNRYNFTYSASRGIGLGFVQALAQDPENAVLATCRNPQEATELQAVAGQQRLSMLLDMSVSRRSLCLYCILNSRIRRSNQRRATGP